MFEKSKIIQELIIRVRAELGKAEDALKSTSSFKSEGDMKQESKYDTRSIEAGYLASAQAKRVEELKLELQQLEEIPIREFKLGEEIALGAIVELELEGKSRNYFLSSTAGGSMVTIDGYDILIISIFSPIGHEALGNRVGDEFELEAKSGKRIYKVKSLT